MDSQHDYRGAMSFGGLCEPIVSRSTIDEADYILFVRREVVIACSHVTTITSCASLSFNATRAHQLLRTARSCR